MQRDALIPELAKLGLAALEVFHPRHDENDRRRYLRLCENYNLIPTGGSDTHGARTGYSQVGDTTVSSEIVERLREAAGRDDLGRAHAQGA